MIISNKREHLLGGIHSQIPYQFLGVQCMSCVPSFFKRTDLNFWTYFNLRFKTTGISLPLGPCFFLYPICLGTRKIWSCGQHLLPTSSLLSIWMTWDRHNLHWASTPDLIIMTTARTSVPWWPFGQRGTCVTPAQKAISWNISYQNELGHKNFRTLNMFNIQFPFPRDPITFVSLLSIVFRFHYHSKKVSQDPYGFKLR